MEAIRRYVAFYLDKAGPEWLIWGCDWPAALLTTDYAGTLANYSELLGPLNRDVEVNLFRTNEAFYNIMA